MKVSTVVVAVIAATLSLSCADDVDAPADEAASTVPDTATSVPATTTTTAAATTSPATTPTTAAPLPSVEISVHFDRRTTDDATGGFEGISQQILTDPRGWQQSGFRFSFGPDAPYSVVLAEPSETDTLCAPYDVQSTYSCQIGPVVALNAERWRTATPTWTGTIDEYRTMLVNHEVGHLLGQHHPDSACPAPGSPAPVMAQQSKGLSGCAANPWPLDWELACAAQHVEPIAPGYEASSTPLCGPGDVP